jgi:hypothetical protein
MNTMRLTKLDVAVSQLRLAISLFLEDRELVSVITLAGAAEEILGKLALQAGLTPALTRRTEGTRALFKHLWKSDLGVKPFVDLKNKTRNELKHLVSGAPIEVNLLEEAMRMLDRAVENYRLLHVRRDPQVAAYERKRLQVWRAHMPHNKPLHQILGSGASRRPSAG